MANVVHSNLTGADAVHPAAYVQTTDPGAVGANKFWVDTTNDLLKRRNTGNSAWIVVAATTSTLSGEIIAQDFKPTGLTGATAVSRYGGATTSGPPLSGTWVVGDIAFDQSGGMWQCITAGSPGAWKPSSVATKLYLAGNYI